AALGNRFWYHETWRRDAGGGNPAKLALPASEAILDVSRDGQNCLTRSRLVTPLNSSALMRMKPDGTDAHPLSEPGGLKEPARFAPDGRLVAYCRNDKGGHSVWVVNADGTGGRQVYADAGAYVEACCWSPDGRRLAVVAANLLPLPDGRQVRIPYGVEEGDWRIVLMDADGQNRNRLPFKAKVVWLRDPDWYVPPE